MKLLVFAIIWCVLAGVAAAEPLYLSQPFDKLKLDENNNNAELKVQPLKFRKLPPQVDRTDELEIELLDRPGEKYKVAWLNIVAIQFFEELVLAEADQLVKAGKYDEAFGYYQFLESQFPKTTGLKEAIETYLYVQIGGLFRAGQDDEALALAVELHRRNPQRQGLSVAYDRISVRLADAHLAKENYAAARGLLKNLAERYPGTKATSVAPREVQLQQKAAALLTEAQAQFTAGKFAAADHACRKLLEVWPPIDGGQQLAAAIREKYPVVTVGVTLPLAAVPAAKAVQAIDWAGVRTGRLIAAGDSTYSVAATSDEARFAAKDGSLPAGSRQPREIVERPFTDSAAALRALRRGEVSAVDRVSPWELKRLASNAQIAVAAYGVPSLHLLVPNPNKPLTASRKFRRAVLYATDREAILRRGLLDGQNIEGCEVLSGPFAREIAPGDAYGAAHNAQVAVRPYDPGLAVALLKLAADEVGASDPAVVLAHPAEPIARVACQSLARQLEFVGLKVRLRELASGQPPPADADLLYVEVVCKNPAADVWRLLGPDGLTGACSPALLAELRLLEGADTKAAAARLQSIHRLAAAELPVIPLWQLVNHGAMRTSLTGVGQRPASLYENVAGWELAGGN